MHFEWRIQASLGGVLALAYFAPHGAALGFSALALYALFGPRQCLQALTVSWLLSFLNPGLFPQAGSESGLKWAVLLASFVSVTSRISMRRIQSFPALLLYAMALVLISLVCSSHPLISILKIFQFFIGVTAVLGAYRQCALHGKSIENWYYNVFIFILGAGLPFYFSSYGFLKNGYGFQGILNHPQTLGVFVAPILAWILIVHVLREKRSPLMLAAIAVGAFSLIVSEARTGIVAVFLAGAVILIPRTSSRVELRVLRGFLARPAIAFGILLMAAFGAINSDSIYNFGVSYLAKRQEDKSVEERFEMSRGFLIQRSLENFSDHPLFGIGFGVPSDDQQFSVSSETLFGLPIGAPTEKGFLPTAVLEETGAVGALLLLLLLAPICKLAARSADLPKFMLFLSCLFVNAGEMVFFSFGGSGLYIWLLIGMVMESPRTERGRSQ